MDLRVHHDGRVRLRAREDREHAAAVRGARGKAEDRHAVERHASSVGDGLLEGSANAAHVLVESGIGGVERDSGCDGLGVGASESLDAAALQDGVAACGGYRVGRAGEGIRGLLGAVVVGSTRGTVRDGCCSSGVPVGSVGTVDGGSSGKGTVLGEHAVVAVRSSCSGCRGAVLAGGAVGGSRGSEGTVISCKTSSTVTL